VGEPASFSVSRIDQDQFLHGYISICVRDRISQPDQIGQRRRLA
jgi:hypothetical protein